jgi:twitching motility protein PilT
MTDVRLNETHNNKPHGTDPLRKTTLPIGSLNEDFVFTEKKHLPQSSDDIDVEIFFTMAIVQKVSDIHLREGAAPIFRRQGQIVHTNFPALTESAMLKFAQWLLPSKLKGYLNARQDMDFAREFQMARLRVNMLYEMNRLGFTVRVIPTQIPHLMDLGLPETLYKFTHEQHGLVLVTGAARNGKSTTLAAMLNQINQESSKHIITLEDPVEFIYRNAKGMVTQRQLGLDTADFPSGVKHALRQDPDVMLIGEIRDRETALAAIKAAETGILVFSTLHTSDCIQTLHRMIDLFEPFERDSVRIQLANVLRGIVCQKLYNQVSGAGQSAVAELLMMTSTIRDYMLKNQFDEIYSLMEEGRFEGMQSMSNAVYRLIQAGKISIEEALRVTNNSSSLKRRLKGAFHGTSFIE